MWSSHTQSNTQSNYTSSSKKFNCHLELNLVQYLRFVRKNCFLLLFVLGYFRLNLLLNGISLGIIAGTAT